MFQKFQITLFVFALFAHDESMGLCKSYFVFSNTYLNKNPKLKQCSHFGLGVGVYGVFAILPVGQN